MPVYAVIMRNKAIQIKHEIILNHNDTIMLSNYVSQLCDQTVRSQIDKSGKQSQLDLIL